MLRRHRRQESSRGRARASVECPHAEPRLPAGDAAGATPTLYRVRDADGISRCPQMWVHSGEGCLESKMHGKVLQIQGPVAEGSEIETSNRTGEPKQVWRFCADDAW